MRKQYRGRVMASVRETAEGLAAAGVGSFKDLVQRNVAADPALGGPTRERCLGRNDLEVLDNHVEENGVSRVVPGAAVGSDERRAVSDRTTCSHGRALCGARYA
jgi:hypothetical protein